MTEQTAAQPATAERDPELQAAMDRAARDLATKLRPFADAMKDPDTFARNFLEALYAGPDQWRPFPRHASTQGGHDDSTYERGLEAAREALRKAREGTTS